MIMIHQKNVFEENLDPKYFYENLETESAFAPYVGFGVLMTSKLGTNVILMRYVTAISPVKESKSW